MKVTKELIEAKINRLYAQGCEIKQVSNLGVSGLVIGEIEIDREYLLMWGDLMLTQYLSKRLRLN